MTREEAIIDLKAKITRIKSILDDGLCANPDRWAIKLKWHEDMLSALHSPQPDPITGLVPCRGCAGSYVQSRVCDYGERTGKTSKTGTHIKSHPYLVGCTKCGITVSVFPREAKTRGYTSAKMCAEDLWNRAMGWKGGAE